MACAAYFQRGCFNITCMPWCLPTKNNSVRGCSRGGGGAQYSDTFFFFCIQPHFFVSRYGVGVSSKFTNLSGKQASKHKENTNKQIQKRTNKTFLDANLQNTGGWGLDPLTPPAYIDTYIYLRVCHYMIMLTEINREQTGRYEINCILIIFRVKAALGRALLAIHHNESPRQFQYKLCV